MRAPIALSCPGLSPQMKALVLLLSENNGEKLRRILLRMSLEEAEALWSLALSQHVAGMLSGRPVCVFWWTLPN